MNTLCILLAIIALTLREGIFVASRPSFTRAQLDNARGLTKLAAESVVASALDLPVARLRAWREQGTGPAYETTVNGLTVYRKNAVLQFIHRHMKEGRP